MGLVLLDSSVLIALLNPTDFHHKSALNSRTHNDEFIISAISITELMPRAIKDGNSEGIWKALKLVAKEIVDVDSEIAMSAARIRSLTGARTPDAIISATAQGLGAQLWTFDAKLAKTTPGARLLA